MGMKVVGILRFDGFMGLMSLEEGYIMKRICIYAGNPSRYRSGQLGDGSSGEGTGEKFPL